jgi:NADH:ubiquinone oxidoreductase subunit C
MFQIKDRLGDIAFEIEEKSARRIYLSVHKSDLRQVAKVLFGDFKARFSIASGMDNGKNFQILYHFSFDELNKIISIRTFVEKDSPAVDSLVPVIGPCVEWIEREMHELLGIYFAGHPNLKRLLLSEDWPEGVYPLRRDFRNE